MQTNVVKRLSFIAMPHLSEKRPDTLRWFKAPIAACLCHLGRISEKARLGAGSVFTAAVPDGGGGLGSSASSQRVNVFTCNLSLNVQCLSCSGVLRPSQWIGSSFGAEGRRPAWEMGPTCAAWWMAAPLPLHVPRLPGGGGRGRGCAGRVPPSAPRSFVRGQRGIAPAPSRRHHGLPAPRPVRAQLSGCRQEQAQLFRAGEVWPSWSNLLRSVTPSLPPPVPPSPPSPPLPRCTQTPTRAQTRHGICPPDLLRSSGKRDHKCNRL
ncbi:uncharacterized protein LOC142056598 [Phalacrocorax aristotelis]|uniref:uncharacterized protein LOC142056598 n=1 Tax=Phalacrocorax aristotelis TaxID=126867 RepID=UPI003F4B95B7